MRRPGPPSSHDAKVLHVLVVPTYIAANNPAVRVISPPTIAVDAWTGEALSDSSTSIAAATAPIVMIRTCTRDIEYGVVVVVVRIDVTAL